MRPHQLVSVYLNENATSSAGTGSTYQDTSLTIYTEADVAQVQLVQETQLALVKIYSSVALDSNNKGIYHLDMDMDYTGRNNGTPQIVRVSLANLPGWVGFNQASSYQNRICFATNTGAVFGETVSFITSTTVEFTMENTGSLRTLHWSLTFIQ